MITAEGMRGEHELLGLCLGTRVVGGRLFVGADRRHMHQARAVCGRGQRHLLGAGPVHEIKALAAALEQNADQVDDHVGIARRRLDRSGVAQIGLHSVDLPNPAERLQVSGELGAAHRGADAVVALGQRAHHMAAEEAGAAINRDEPFEIAFGVHDAILGSLADCRGSAIADRAISV